MDEEFFEDSGVTATASYKTRLVRVIDSMITPATLGIDVEIVPVDGDIFSAAMTEGLIRARHWVENHIAGAIAMAVDNGDAFNMFFDERGELRCANQVMLTPGMPTDDLLAALFASKIQAIFGEVAGVATCRISSDNALQLSFCFYGDPEATLPGVVDWIGPRSYFEDPWWARPDSSTFDVIPSPGADLSIKPSWSRPILPNLNLSDDGEDAAVDPSASVLRPNFRPVVIDGGRNPDE